MQILFFFSLFFKRQFSGTFFFFCLSQRWKGEIAKEKTDSQEEAARSGRERSWRGAACRGHPGRPLPRRPWTPSNVHIPHVGGRAGQVQLLLLFLLLGGLGVQVLLLGLAQARLQQGFDLLLAGPKAVLWHRGQRRSARVCG